MGTASNMAISPWGALLIGCSAGALSTVGYAYLTVKLTNCVLSSKFVGPQCIQKDSERLRSIFRVFVLCKKVRTEVLSFNNNLLGNNLFS